MDLATGMIADGGPDEIILASRPLIAVGGGAFAVPDQMAGISEVLRPAYGTRPMLWVRRWQR